MSDLGFTIKRNDRREPIVRTLKGSNGLPVDLSSASAVKFIMISLADGSTKVNAAAIIINPATNGQVQYNWAAGDTDTAGYYSAEWEVTYQDTTKQSFPNDGKLIIHVNADLG